MITPWGSALRQLGSISDGFDRAANMMHHIICTAHTTLAPAAVLRHRMLSSSEPTTTTSPSCRSASLAASRASRKVFMYPRALPWASCYICMLGSQKPCFCPGLKCEWRHFAGVPRSGSRELKLLPVHIGRQGRQWSCGQRISASPRRSLARAKAGKVGRTWTASESGPHTQTLSTAIPSSKRLNHTDGQSEGLRDTHICSPRQPAGQATGSWSLCPSNHQWTDWLTG